MHISGAMPSILPYLLRLAADPEVPYRGRHFDTVLVTAALPQPVDPGNPRDLAINGPEEEHPE
ncbi:hypothetical protein [Streptomyces sp. NPDC054854]